ncbi:MAG: class I SAM-dependent methyltransferase [Candidatus Abyssobacteria bacterium SURF_17]|jgi:ubiquinone/menaquinone biosynthesis C-methylase UbiE|uniref:Class I SAM-dependent methyltransferase n=1 Tax=Candidatus Abyssobacteria bacterium SURF_17 TaxID=2093361 RepID=A0A419ET44_9BACT|nr:MAG: class I SAM-dependent methyltransferase [Candidatus Abyssubacteria bacterium SURF_17]
MVDYDEIASDYARHRRIHAELARRLVAGSRIYHASTVLEVGCGTGNYITAVEAATGCRCWGIDPSEQMLTRARGRTTRVHFERGLAEKLTFPDETFDFVFSVDVIHHVTDRTAHFLETHRVLKTGASLCTVTESEWMIRNRRPLANYFPETVEPELRRYPPIPGLRRMMRDAGFADVCEESVEVTYQLTDIRAYRDKAFSSLRLIDDTAFQRGIERLARDLNNAPIPCVSRYLLLWATRN